MTYDPHYAKRWHYARTQGILQWVPVDPARAHVNQLIAAGYTPEAIAQAAGVSATALRSIAGRYAATSNISRHVAHRITRITPAKVLASITEPSTLVPSLGAKRRIRALQALGHTLADIDAHTGHRPRLAKYIADRRDGMTVTFDKHAAIVRAFEALSGTPGRSVRGRADAARRGWVPPLAWDDDDIDDPDAFPYEPELGRRRTSLDVAEDVEDLLKHDPTLTSAQLAHRLGYSDKSGIQNALAAGRANRPDLLARLARNAEERAA